MKKIPSTRWTEPQEARLLLLATKVPMDRLVKEIGRFRGAFSAKAFSLRLSLDRRRNSNNEKLPKLPPRSGDQAVGKLHG